MFIQATTVCTSQGTSTIDPIADGATLVYKGKVTGQLGWNQIYFDKGFLLPAGMNLMWYVVDDDPNNACNSSILYWCRNQNVGYNSVDRMGQFSCSGNSSGTTTDLPTTIFYFGVSKGDGKVQSILVAERLVLNLMQRMSGIATTTRKYVRCIEGTHARLLDTRKTTPNLRILEKMAVRIGGGCNHRMGLYDMIMLKDNHIDFAGGLKNVLEKTNRYLKEKHLDLKVEIECRSLDDVRLAMSLGGFHRIMFDNFTPEKVREGVALVQGRYETEASGGITLENIRAYAETGVDFISVGALTHSVKSLDLSLKAIS